MNLNFLGASEDVPLAAYEKYLSALRDRTKGAFAGMLAAYQTLKKIREAYGLPVVGTSGEARVRVGALTDSEYEQMLELASMTETITRVLDDALANKRRLGYDRATEDLQIERLPEDPVRIETRNNRPTVVSNVTNQPERITGTLGLHPIVWVGLGIAGVAVTVGSIYTVNNAMESATTIVQAHAAKTIHMKNAELAEKGIDPQGAANATKTVLDASADLSRAQGEASAKRTGLTPDTNKTIRTVAIVGVIAAGIYLISKVIPNREPRIVAA